MMFQQLWLVHHMKENNTKSVKLEKEKAMKQNCKTCGWGRQIPHVKTIMKCGCPLSGCYQTDILETESCDSWKKASDEYLKTIGELK